VLFNRVKPRRKRNQSQLPWAEDAVLLRRRTLSVPNKLLMQLHQCMVVFSAAEDAEVRVKILEERLLFCYYV
jgi:hypothetical protein